MFDKILIQSALLAIGMAASTASFAADSKL